MDQEPGKTDIIVYCTVTSSRWMRIWYNFDQKTWMFPVMTLYHSDHRSPSPLASIKCQQLHVNVSRYENLLFLYFLFILYTNNRKKTGHPRNERWFRPYSGPTEVLLKDWPLSHETSEVFPYIGGFGPWVSSRITSEAWRAPRLDNKFLVKWTTLFPVRCVKKIDWYDSHFHHRAFGFLQTNEVRGGAWKFLWNDG